MPERRPNIILIITDQQRYDTVGALGFPYMQTPALDRLVREGVAFEQCFCAAPSCVPARASFFNARYPHSLGVYNNSDRWDHSWVEQLQAAGYHTANIGKMHTIPMDVPCGFDQRFVVENKDRPWSSHPHGNYYDEWDKFLHNLGLRKPSRDTYRAEHPQYETALGAYEWPLDERYHPDVFVGSMARWFIEQRLASSPLFLEIGFPGPHPPYDPPARFLRAYDDVDIPVPQVTDDEIAHQPPPQATYRRELIGGNHDAVRWHERPTPQQLLRLRRHYAANMTLIDEQIALILETLGKRGYLENAIVLFTSDHGDCLGDHGQIQKWTMYDCIVRVPTLVWAPGRLPAGKRVGELIQQFDLVPLLFELAGLQPPPGPALSALAVACGEQPGRQVVFAEQSADNVFQGVNLVTMVRSHRWKLVHYLDQPWGELYDLESDPAEVRNLWHEPAQQAVRQELLALLRDWRIRDALCR